MEIKRSLADIVGSDNVFDEPSKLRSYARDQSLAYQRAPNYVAYVETRNRSAGLSNWPTKQRCPSTLSVQEFISTGTPYR
jgi:hypothetical protein